MRFRRAGWLLTDWPSVGEEVREEADLVFVTVAAALEDLQLRSMGYYSKEGYLEEIDEV